VIERWQHSIDSGEAFEMGFPLRGADGGFRWFLTRVQPLRDVDGCILRWFGSNTNIDERRRNGDFKEIFLGILGHDLRNPLSSILAIARVLNMRDDVSVEIRKRMDRVVASGVRMQRMIEQLLDLTRARLAGGIPVELSATALPFLPLVSKIVDEVRVAHPQVTIETRVENHCAARIDSDRFEQVISNLLGNAVTHGDPKKPILVVLTSRGNGASLTVHNWGRPIHADFLPLLFNPFARIEKSSGRTVGLGLGLYISERIVDAHGGRLTVHSSADEGTRFEVLIPSS
jgi:signal transduction histidine kinase